MDFIKQIINHATAVSAANEYEKKIFESLNKNSKIKIIRNRVNLKTLVSKEDYRKKYEINSKLFLWSLPKR